ncbi:alpha/beta hydrolase family protein [Microbacterium sp. Mu-80]|uniref:Alpha/beta hydrolase family protein n=1 Tax=Microbacterium bandirmense TaxID=3122050 RepID=A0ABU8LBV3_9MICO
MRLNAIETGTGDRVVVLLHGMMGSAESWWRVAPLLVANGFRVIALDLPGHGCSPRDERCTVASAADAVVATLAACAPDAAVHGIGHSYGGTVLAAVTERMPMGQVVYVDSACAFEGGAEQRALAEQYEHDRRNRRDPAWLLSSRPFYSATDAEVEARAAERFDPMTMASISVGDDVAHEPGSGSILVRAEPSAFVSDSTAARLRAAGVDVRDIPGAAHTIWYSHFEQFRAALPEFFGST